MPYLWRFCFLFNWLNWIPGMQVPLSILIDCYFFFVDSLANKQNKDPNDVLRVNKPNTSTTTSTTTPTTGRQQTMSCRKNDIFLLFFEFAPSLNWTDVGSGRGGFLLDIFIKTHSYTHTSGPTFIHTCPLTYGLLYVLHTNILVTAELCSRIYILMTHICIFFLLSFFQHFICMKFLIKEFVFGFEVEILIIAIFFQIQFF